MGNVNGWANRETWVWGLWNDNWLADRAQEIADAAEAVWDGAPESIEEYIYELRGYLHDAIVQVLEGDIDALRQEAEDAFGSSSFLIDLLCVHERLDAIDLKELADHYVSDWISEVKHGDYLDRYPIVNVKAFHKAVAV